MPGSNHYEVQICTKLRTKNKLARYVFDFLYESKIVIELKQGSIFSKQNINQTYSYLKATGLKLGLLVNFTRGGVKFKRVVNLK